MQNPSWMWVRLPSWILVPFSQPDLMVHAVGEWPHSLKMGGRRRAEPGVAARDDAEAFDVVDLALVEVRVGAAHDLDGEVFALCNVAAPEDWLRSIVGGGRHHQHAAS